MLHRAPSVSWWAPASSGNGRPQLHSRPSISFNRQDAKDAKKIEDLASTSLIRERKATDALAPIHFVQVMPKRVVVPPLAVLASWRFPLPAFTHDDDNGRSIGNGRTCTLPTAIVRSKTPPHPLREALRFRMRKRLPFRTASRMCITTHLK